MRGVLNILSLCDDPCSNVLYNKFTSKLTKMSRGSKRNYLAIKQNGQNVLIPFNDILPVNSQRIFTKSFEVNYVEKSIVVTIDLKKTLFL